MRLRQATFKRFAAAGGLIGLSLAMNIGIAERAAFGQTAPVPPVLQIPAEGAVLQGLDKVTARITTFRVPLDTIVIFGSLEINVRACEKKPPTEPPESSAFLEIDDVNPEADRQRVFSGWMFASSPALSALEHPVYDVWVIDCMKR